MTDIAELALKVDARQVKDANAELDRMSSASKKVDKDVDTFAVNANSKLASITRSLGLVAAGFVSLSTVRSLLDASIQLEKFNNALQVATGSAKGAAEEMAFVRAESDRLGLNLQTTAEQYSRLAAAAKGTELQGQSTRDIFTSVAQAATVMGLSAAETGGALTALEQIISKGKVSAEELRGQLGERLPGAFQIAARSIGVTTAELDKLLSTGNLTAEQLLPALAAELNRTFGPQAVEAAQGLNAQINRFNTAVFNLKIAIGELGLIELFNAGIQVVTSFVNVINTRLLPAVKSVAEFINSIPVVSTVVKAAFGGGWLATVKSANAETQALNTNLAQTETIARAINIEAPVIKAAKATRTLNKELNDQKREAERTADEIKRLTREYDPLFKRNEELARLIELRAKGLPESIFNSAAAAAINDYIAAIGKTEGAIQKISKVEQTVLDGTRNFWDTNEQIWIQGVRNIQTSLANGLFNIFDDGLKGMVNGVKRAVGQMIAEFASIKILQGTGIAGLLGLGSTAAMASGGGSGGLGALSSISNIIGSGFGVSNLIGSGISGLGSLTGSGSLTAFGQAFTGDAIAGFAGQAGAFGASAGSAFSAVAGPAMIAAVADIGLRQLFGDKKLGGTAGDILSYVPVVGTLINGLFGRGAPKFQNEALVGNVSTGGFEGVLNQAFRESGSVFRGSRTSNFIADTDTGNLLNQFGRLSESGNIPGALRDSATDPAVKRALEVGEFLDEAFGSIGDTLKETAEKLGLSSDALNNFSAELDLVSEKGETLSEAQISDEIARISDEMAKTLIPNLDEFAKSGESATEAVVRLGNQFAVLENAVSAIFGMSGQSAQDFINQFSIPDQTAFIDAAGGIESFSQKINQFIEGLPDTDKLDILQASLSEALSAVGVDFIPTMDQFRDAMKSGELSAEQFLAGLDLQGALQQYEDLSNAVAEPLNNVIERIGAASQTAIDPADQLLSKLDALGLGALDTSQEIIDAVQSLGESAGLTQTQFDGLVKAMDETSGGIESLIDAERQLAEERKRAAAADRRDFVAARRAGEMRDAAAFAALNQRVIDIRIKDLQTAIDNIEKQKEARRLLFLENPEEYLQIESNPGTQESMALLEQIRTMMQYDPRLQNFTSEFDVREEFERDGSWLNSFFGDAIRQMSNGSNFWEIISKRIVDHFKNVNLANGADGLNDLRKQFELGVGEFAPDPVDTANIERERIGLETQLLQLQGDTAALRQRELDALDESNRELLQRIFNLQDEQAEQQRLSAIAQEREGLEKQLMQLQGDNAGLRQLELDALDESNRELLQRIFNLQDEQAIAQERAGLETQLMQLMGDTEGLRQRELEAIDGSNRELLQRIFNLQDEQAEQQRLAAIAQERAGLETQLMQLQGDTAGLRQLELDALDESNRSLLERIFSIQDENIALEKQKQIADERFGLETRLLELNGDTAALRQRELDALSPANRELQKLIFARQDEIEAMQKAEEISARITAERIGLENELFRLQGNTDALRKRQLEALDPSNRGLQEQIFDLIDSQSASEDLKGAVSVAYDALLSTVQTEQAKVTAAFNANISSINDSISKVNSKIGDLKSLSSSLASSINDVFPLSLSSAQRGINDIISNVRSGVMPDSSELSTFVNRLTNVKPENFENRESFLFAQARSVQLIDELRNAADDRVSIEEATIDTLRERITQAEMQFGEEMGRLNTISSLAGQQVEAIGGVERSVITMSDSISKFSDAVAAAIKTADINKDLKEEIKKLKGELENIKSSSAETARRLKSISPDGDAIQTRSAAA